MKVTVLLFIVLTLLGLCGCQANKPQAEGSPDVLTAPNFPNEKEQEGVIMDAVQAVGGTAVPAYDPKDYADLPTRTNTTAILSDTTPKTTAQLQEQLGTSGLIVSGYATGNRISYDEDGAFYTKAQFIIDRVFLGSVSPGTTITVSEGYVVRENKKETFIYAYDPEHSYLQNDEYVLLIAKPSKLAPGCYTPIHNPLPIATDCAEWSEEYLDRLLDYFRGDPSTYVRPQDEVYTENGYLIKEEAPDWPRREISNEEMIAELQDNLLIYLATELRIKIWPTEHINYVDEHCGRTKHNMQRWQLPESQLYRYGYDI